MDDEDADAIIIIIIMLVVIMVIMLFSYLANCSTSPPGGNQVDGLPPAASLSYFYFILNILQIVSDELQILNNFQKY